MTVLKPGGLTAFFVAGAISGPLKTMCAAMKELASGNLEVTIPAQGKKDEIGEMAKAVLVFQTAAVENARLERAAASNRAQAEGERAGNERAQREAIEQERAIVANSIGTGLTKLAAKDLTFRMSSDIPAAYRKLQTDFNAAIEQLEERNAERRPAAPMRSSRARGRYRRLPTTFRGAPSSRRRVSKKPPRRSTRSPRR